MANMKKFWDSLDQNIVVNKRELFLGVAACALAGIVIGTFLSPRITLTIGNNNVYDNASAPQEEDAEEEASDAVTEE